MNEIATFTSPSGDEMVVIPAAEYRQLKEAVEMAEDVAAYDEIKAKLAAGEEEFIPAEYVNRLLDGDNPVLVWREFRGMTSKQLAEAAGITAPYLSQIETGKRDGTVSTMKKIALALRVQIDDLV
jgi:DNA-binding Xre family transcriptional regulator